MDAANRPRRPGWPERVATRPVAVWLVLAGVAVLSYANTFHASFHFDDANSIVDNSQIRSFTAFRDLSGTRYVGALTFAVNYAVGGVNPVGYHVVNLLIHIINGGLVYTLVRLLSRTPALQAGRGPDGQPPGNGIAIVTALLFVAHPLQTQAVTYVVQRYTSLAALFYLLAVVCYLQWRLAATGSRGRYGWYAGAVAATVLAMKTKENTFTLPLMLLLIEGVGFGLPPWRKWRPLVPFVLLLPLIPLSLPPGMGLEDRDSGLARETTEISRLSYFATQCRVLVTYLRLMVWPVGQNVDYDYPIAHSLLEPPVLASGLFLAGLLGLALYVLWKQPGSRLVGVGLVWFFLTVSVESSIIPIRDVIFEHRMYLPSVGVLLAGSVLGASLLAGWRVVPVTALVALVALLAGATYQRNRVWADELTLWRDAVVKSPQKARAHMNLGLAYAQQGRVATAIEEYQTALQLRPDYAEAHSNLGNVYAQQGQVAAAIQEYRAAIQANPDFPDAHYNLGNVYARQGQVGAVIQEYQTTLQLRPDFAEAHHNLGHVYLLQDRSDDAIAELVTAIRLDPSYAEAHTTLGLAYAQQGRLDDAIQEYRTAIRLKPDGAEAYTNLGNAYAQQGQVEAAIQEHRAAILANPDFPDAHYNLGNAYAQQGQLAAAIQEYQTALQLRPDFAEAHHNLGHVYLLQDRSDDAIAELVTAVRLRPASPEFHYNLGNVYAQQGRFDEAIQAFLASVRLKPDVPEAEAKLGAAYAQQGRWAEAIGHYQRALQLRADWADVRFQLGQVYRRQGRVPEARREFEAVVRLRPDFAPAQQALTQLDGRR